MASPSSRVPLADTPPHSPDNPGETQPRSFGVNRVWPLPGSSIDDQKQDIDVVAIHGLCTQSDRAWLGYKNRKNEGGGTVNWLNEKEMLPSMIKNPRVLTYDWNAEVDGSPTHDSIFGQATSFLTVLDGYRRQTESTDRPIIFIASCYGGLLLAAALEHAREDSSPSSILYNTVGIAFLGTPFRGCADDFLTVTQLRILIAIKGDDDYSKDLVTMLEKHHDGDLHYLISRFCQMVAKQANKFPIACFYERHKTDFSQRQQSLIKVLDNPDLDIEKFAVGKVMLVDKRAGTLDSASLIGLEANHTTLNKFFGPSDPSFMAVAGVLGRMADDVVETYKSKSAARSCNHHVEGQTPQVQHESIPHASKPLDLTDDMPPGCEPYQPQTDIDQILTEFCSLDNERQSKRLLVHGLAGRGKTQSCVALMRKAKEESSSRWSSLLWLNAHSIEALFESLRTIQENLRVSKSPESASSLEFSADATRSSATDIRTWLSRKNQPWLMVIDNLFLEDGTAPNGTPYFAVLDHVLDTLHKTDNGRIIITARRRPDTWTNFEWCKLDHDAPSGTRDNTHSMSSTSPGFAQKLVRSHLPREKLRTSRQERAALQLCELLDFLPFGISIACAKIRDDKRSIEWYVTEWKRVFGEQPKDANLSDNDRSINCALKLSYDTLQSTGSGSDNLNAADLLHILACFNASNISEALFRKAWESAEFGVLPPQQNMEQHHGPRTIWQSFEGRLAAIFKTRWGSRCEDNNTLHMKPGFLNRPEEENKWESSKAKKYLRKALRTLSNLSFLYFSDDENDCDIHVSPLVQAWIRHYPYAAGSLQAHRLREAWWQACFTLATSLASKTRLELRVSRTLYLRQAAAYIEGLRSLSDSLDQTTRSEQDTESGELSWTGNVLKLERRGAAVRHFADALNEGGYPLSAKQLREAYDQVMPAEVDTLEQLAHKLVYADEREQNGDHKQALEIRVHMVQRLRSLTMPEIEVNSSMGLDFGRTLLGHIIGRDIAESLWYLGRTKESTQRIETILDKVEPLQMIWDLDRESNLQAKSVFNVFLMEARILGARCLVRYDHSYKKAQKILDRALVDHILHSHSPWTDEYEDRQRFLRAREVKAEILFAKGEHCACRSEREQILFERKKDDPKLENLNTREAQIAYANSLTSHDESLELREEVEAWLCDNDDRVPEKHEFVTKSRLDLARCYINVAEAHFTTKHQEYNYRGQELIKKAAHFARNVWIISEGIESRGLTHPQTLKSLALMMKTERLIEKFENCENLEGLSAKSVFERTKAHISNLIDKDPEVERAWFRVQLENCLVNKTEERLKKVERLRCAFREDTQDYLRDEVMLKIDYEKAQAEMRILNQWPDQEKRGEMKKEERFCVAAESLEHVWEMSCSLYGEKDPFSIEVLYSAAEAYRIIRHSNFEELQKTLCVLLHEIDGVPSARAEKELKVLNRGRGRRKTDRISWAELISTADDEAETARFTRSDKRGT